MNGRNPGARQRTTRTPGDAVRVAEELLSREKANVLMGTFASNVGLAVANLANQRKVLFVASEPLTDKLVWENGNRYTFRLRPSTYMQTAMLIPQAAKLNKKRWAIVYPNYEYGQSATASFKKLLAAAQPGVEFVTEQAPALGKIEAGAVVQALAEAKPDAIFSSLFAADLQKFVREGNTRGLFKNVAGQPLAASPIIAIVKDETAVGLWVRLLRGARSTRPSTAFPELPKRCKTTLGRLCGRLHRRSYRGTPQEGTSRTRKAGRALKGPNAVAVCPNSGADDHRPPWEPTSTAR